MRVCHATMIARAAAGLMLALCNEGHAQDSLGMRRVAELDYWVWADDIQMVGDTAYVVSGSVLHIVDLSEPARPFEIGQGSWSDTWGGNRVCVTGGRAYVAAGFELAVFDVSNPTAPVKLTEWEAWEGSELTDVFVHGDDAIVKVNGYLYMVDISDLQHIQIVGEFPNFISPTSPVGMVGDYLCMNGLGVSVWDIHNPAQPTKVADTDTLVSSRCATISGGYVYRSTFEDGLRIVDVCNPLQPVVVGWCDSGRCEAVTVTGNHAVVSKDCGLDIWNVADPAQPVFESAFAPQTRFTAVSSFGSFVCAGDREFHSPSLMVVDITNPSAPTEISAYGTKGFIERMAVYNSIAYVAGGPSDLRAIDLSDPTEIVDLGSSHEESPSGSRDLALRGDYAYLACGTQGLLVYDVSDPANPESLMAEDRPTDNVKRILTAGDYAYVIDGATGLRTYSLENPAVPVCVNILSALAYDYLGFAISNGYLYLGGDREFRVYSLSDPAAPQLVGSCELLHTWGRVEDLAVLDNYAYVAYMHGGLRIIDVSDPTYPTEVSSVWEPTWAVAASGNTIITRELNRLCVREVTDRLNPVTVGYYTTDGYVGSDLEIFGPYLLTAWGPRFRVYQCDALGDAGTPSGTLPQELALYPCYPNPFNAATNLRYYLPEGGRVRLEVLNLMGQKVATLVNGTQSAGTHQILWNGQNGSGTQVSSGVYFVTLSAVGRSASQRITLIK